mmetsp:Transcript_2201/g.3466  ORF Transcript_2201/g.3466 Transcript_2201/m.3466 type:complete len:134 (+) Transcript_2201:92-493(+)
MILLVFCELNAIHLPSTFRFCCQWASSKLPSRVRIIPGGSYLVSNASEADISRPVSMAHQWLDAISGNDMDLAATFFWDQYFMSPVGFNDVRNKNSNNKMTRRTNDDLNPLRRKPLSTTEDERRVPLGGVSGV